MQWPIQCNMQCAMGSISVSINCIRCIRRNSGQHRLLIKIVTFISRFDIARGAYFYMNLMQRINKASFYFISFANRQGLRNSLHQLLRARNT